MTPEQSPAFDSEQVSVRGAVSRRRRLAVLVPVALVAAGIALYTLVGYLGVLAEERNADRDSVTGVVRGAERRVLGADSAPKAMLFIPGFVGGSDNFADVPDAVADRGWHVVVMRVPGHGTSPRDFARYGASEIVEAVVQEAAGLRKSHPCLVLAGHSMGAALATIAAAEVQPEGLILAAPYFRARHRWYYVLPPETWIRIASPLVPYVYKGELFTQVNRSEAKAQIFSYTWTPTHGLRVLAEIGRRANRSEVLRAIACPVLALCGEGDVAVSPAGMASTLKQMATTQQTLCTYEKSNHHLFWDYDRDEVKADILEFARSIE